MFLNSLNCKITVQKKEIEKTEYEQEIEKWADFFTCWAEIKASTGKEYFEAQIQNVSQTYSVAIRYCKKLSDMTPTDYRIVFHNEIYDIKSIDNERYRNFIIKMKVEKKAIQYGG